MSFTAQPVDGSSPTPIPMASVVPDGTNTPLAVEGGPSVTTGGNTLAPPAVYMYDGYNVTFGKQNDASASSDSGTFTFMALIKRLLGKILVGQQTMTNSVGVVIASDQSNLPGNTKQLNGTTISVNQGTIDAGTQRMAQGGAGTGTKSNVTSLATSVTILAANTARKGAMIYNDSTQVLYLDLSGGTASNSSYSTQVGPQVLFELPGPAVYNGAITGIWAAANGNARVTEFS